MADRETPWTHPSVVALAQGGDPMEAITKRARQLVWQASERGWTGPPFDPFELAEVMGIRTVAREDIQDARILPVGANHLVIEFNPNRPRGRIRYSVAHDLAHALFPDCGETVRNRSQRAEMSGDEWQLEMLCNVAASEFLMPTGTFPELAQEKDLTIDHLMALRAKFDVSAEALLLRVARLTSQRCFVFAASRLSDSVSDDRYRLEYAVPSRTCPVQPRRGGVLPTKTLLAKCTAIGFTNNGIEEWPGDFGRVRLECVGIPAYPGRVYPRVVGIGCPTSNAASNRPIIRFVRGDATKPHGRGDRLVAFVVNDKAPTWGAGFAKVVRLKWPVIQHAFRVWAAERRDRLKLGRVFFSDPVDGLIVAAMIAQHGYGPSRSPRIRYSALGECLDQVATAARDQGNEVHMPRIGCGEARGDWQVVSELVDQAICGRGIPVTVYDIPGAPVPPRNRSLFEPDLGD